MQLSVIMDNRERNTKLIGALEGAGMEVRIAPVPVGDYVISDRVCIERKTVRDFESSLMSGRLFDQVGRLKEHYPSPIILLEGSREEFRLSGNVIAGALAYLYIDSSVQVLMSESPEESAKLIELMARHEQEPNRREPSLKGGAKAYTDMEYQERIIGNLPGIGPKLAKSLLKRFRSIRGLANATVEELMEVDKIGKKKAGRIRLLMDAEYGLFEPG